MRAPSARSMKNGSPPTLRNARTGELTPPGILFCAARNNSEEREFKIDWRRGRESNPRIAVLQTATLPLGYPAAFGRGIIERARGLSTQRGLRTPRRQWPLPPTPGCRAKLLRGFGGTDVFLNGVFAKD